jgi:hypothetical protein
VSGRSDLDAGDAGNGRGDAPMDVAMEMAMVVTPIAVVIAGATIFVPTERNANGKQTRMCKVLVAPSDCRSHMERMIPQQALELKQLHRTVEHFANLVKGWAALKEAQRLVMLTWMHEREQK